MKFVSLITKLDIFRERILLQFKHLINFLEEVIFPYTSLIVKDSEIFRLNKFY